MLVRDPQKRITLSQLRDRLSQLRDKPLQLPVAPVVEQGALVVGQRVVEPAVVVAQTAVVADVEQAPSAERTAVEQSAPGARAVGPSPPAARAVEQSPPLAQLVAVARAQEEHESVLGDLYALQLIASPNELNNPGVRQVYDQCLRGRAVRRALLSGAAYQDAKRAPPANGVLQTASAVVATDRSAKGVPQGVQGAPQRVVPQGVPPPCSDEGRRWHRRRTTTVTRVIGPPVARSKPRRIVPLTSTAGDAKARVQHAYSEKTLRALGASLAHTLDKLAVQGTRRVSAEDQTFEILEALAAKVVITLLDVPDAGHRRITFAQGECADDEFRRLVDLIQLQCDF
jgi:hypothetical protein